MVSNRVVRVRPGADGVEPAALRGGIAAVQQELTVTPDFAPDSSGADSVGSGGFSGVWGRSLTESLSVCRVFWRRSRLPLSVEVSERPDPVS